MTLDPRIASSNWEEAFGEPGDYGAQYPMRAETVEVIVSTSNAPFSRADVVEVIHLSQSHDTDDTEWDGVGVFLLADGRYACVAGSCDYTGWGCQDYARRIVSNDLPELIRLGLTDEDRRSLGLVAGA